MRASSLAALRLTRIENFTPDLRPVQDWIRGITEPLNGYGEVVKVLQVALNRMTNHVRPAAPKLGGSLIQCGDQRSRKSRGNLVHGIVKYNDVKLVYSNLNAPSVHQKMSMPPTHLVARAARVEGLDVLAV